MDSGKETVKTAQSRLNVLRKALVSEENSVQYYDALLKNTPEDSEENTGMRRMYQDLRDEETKHVAAIRAMVTHWEAQLKSLENQ